jgi:Icc-related predicted phosphoesterase
VRVTGAYPVRADPDLAEELRTSPQAREEAFHREAETSLARWLDWADATLAAQGRRMAVTLADSDPPWLDPLLENRRAVFPAQGLLELDRGHVMLSEGRTPGKAPGGWRSISEQGLHEALELAVAQAPDVYRAVFNIHVPPYGSRLDDAPVREQGPGQDGRRARHGPTLEPRGSRAVRHVIERHQPLAGLHGHAHQARGTARIGRTQCCNPGSLSHLGALWGYLLLLENGRLRGWQAVSG